VAIRLRYMWTCGVSQTNPRVKNGDVIMFEQWQPWWDVVLLLTVSALLFSGALWLDERGE